MIKRKISILILLFVLVTSSATATFAESVSGNIYIRAEQLNQLGLLQGTGSHNYDLKRSPTRAESVAMLIRLTGNEEEALRYKGSASPFYDVPVWADKYISYAYQNGLTKGVSKSQFGSSLVINSNQYITLLLRALGYSDDEGDFSYADPRNLAAGIGLLDSWNENPEFLRADMVLLSYNALLTTPKGSDAPLFESLLKSGILSEEDWERAFALNDIVIVPRSNYEWKKTASITVSEKGELHGIFRKALEKIPAVIDVNIPAGKESEYRDFVKSTFDSLFGFAKEFKISFYNRSGMISLIPKYSKGYSCMAYLKNPTVPVSDEIKTLAMKGFDIFKEELLYKKYNATEYELVKAIHDYIVNALEYDLHNRPGADDIDGALNAGKATCGGYSALFQFLAELSGLEAETVYGRARNANGVIENHAWNMVKVGGAWYHMDVTWDDPITNTKEGVIRYTYFLLGDDDISKDHTWSRNFYPQAPSSWR